jgi:hypothetical protein
MSNERSGMRSLKNVIILLLLFFGGFVVFQYFGNDRDWSDKYNLSTKLSEALADSVEHFKTENGELGAEKRTLQGNIDDILKENDNLSKNQESLLNTIKRINKEHRGEKEVWAAARITYETLIDSMNNVIATAANIDTVNNVVSFVQTDTAAHFIYDLDVLGVRPYPESIVPEMRFNKVDFPNAQTITFQFDKTKRKDFPVSFTVLNTNQYYKVYDLDSYTIPNIQKEVVNPTTGQKIWKWFKINGKYVLVGAAGYAIGSAASK